MMTERTAQKPHVCVYGDLANLMNLGGDLPLVSETLNCPPSYESNTYQGMNSSSLQDLHSLTHICLDLEV
ncbi:hypothetical protein [Agarilytica rhodophyticola]|uniref:hypothetical protein n=1 Tax=Agarilytica rhodophyticola TaxID=1737490 RepID=UPI0013159DD0|nr:hypothetical protein [Agarilytica rhodophyticola]